MRVGGEALPLHSMKFIITSSGSETRLPGEVAACYSDDSAIMTIRSLGWRWDVLRSVYQMFILNILFITSKLGRGSG